MKYFHRHLLIDAMIIYSIEKIHRNLSIIYIFFYRCLCLYLLIFLIAVDSILKMDLKTRFDIYFLRLSCLVGRCREPKI